VELEKALEVDPKSKEISSMLRETTRKRNTEKGEARRAEKGEKGSGFKFDLSKSSSTSGKSASDATQKDSGPVHIPAPKDTGREFVGCGTQSIVEEFLKNSLTSAITQFAQQGLHLARVALLSAVACVASCGCELWNHARAPCS